MMTRSSLLFRFVVGLTVTQLFVYFVVWPTTAILVTYLGLSKGITDSINYWAEPRAMEVVEQSLVRAQDGSAYLEPSPSLRAYFERNPNFRFAIIDGRNGTVLPGSSMELASAISGLNRIRIIRTHFQIVGDSDPNGRGVLKEVSPPFIAAIYGYVFHWDDLFAIMRSLVGASQLAQFAPFTFFAIAISWIVTRFALTPLYEAKAQLERIDLKSLNQRIQSSGAPKELAPFLEAVNTTLARLEESAKRQHSFTANAAHELLTPVSILRARLDSPTDPSFLHDIDRDVRRLQSIIEQLLLLARRSDQERLASEDVDLGKLVRQIIADYMPLVVKSGRSVEFVGAPSPVVARANRQALECILSNLINNALRAEPVGGAIQVRVCCDASIEIVDHGEGVAPGDRELIFEPFWRKNDATRGTGLGLAIVKELIERQGGNISVVETTGGGATFRVTLPQS